MKIFLKTLLLLLVSVVVFAGISPKVSAAFTEPFQDTCDGSQAASSSSVCNDSGRTVVSSKQTSKDFINKVANIIAIVGGILAVIFIMINGLTLLMSTGDSTKVNKGRDGIIYAAVGIAVIILARSIVAFILRFV